MMPMIPRYKIALVPAAPLSTIPSKIIGTSSHAVRLFDDLRKAPKEELWVLLLDCRHRPIGIHQVSVGIINKSLVHPREVFISAILAMAKAIILVHNHPSGDTTPSPEDKEVTTRIVTCGHFLGIPLIDHIIMGSVLAPDACGNYHSLREHGFSAFTSPTLTYSEKVTSI